MEIDKDTAGEAERNIHHLENLVPLLIKVLD